MKSDENLAHVRTREKSKGDDLSCKWLRGRGFLHVSKDPVSEYFLHVNHGKDKKIRSNASLKNRFKRFFTSISAITVLKPLAENGRVRDLIL